MGWKIDKEGKFLPFAGITVVASATRNADNYPVLQAIHDGLKLNPIIARSFSLLPVDSLHMTTLNLYTEEFTEGNWLDFVDSKLPMLNQLDRTMKQRDFSPVVSPKCVYVKGVIHLHLNSDKKQDEALLELAEEFSLTRHISDCHITFGYQYKPLSDETLGQLHKQVFDIVNDALVKHRCTELVLCPARLCYFHDMTEFIPWDAAENPFEKK